MARRLLALVISVLVGAGLVPLIVASPAAAWTDYVSASKTYPTHSGYLYLYADAEGHNWGCSALGLAMDCADGQNVYGSVSYLGNSRPSVVQVQVQIAFSGSGLSVGIPPNGSGSAAGNTCSLPVFQNNGTFVSTTTNGVVCHAQTVLAITGMTLWVFGWGKWGSAWYGTSASGFLDMYPR
jgi:hypothetical protein